MHYCKFSAQYFPGTRERINPCIGAVTTVIGIGLLLLQKWPESRGRHGHITGVRTVISWFKLAAKRTRKHFV
jgi:hypothetical protein